MKLPALLLVLILLATSVLRAAPLLPVDARRILVLGDSITYDGRYVAAIETWFLRHEPEPERLWLNLGVPSENVSGLSEAGHAGGKFPRPDLHERLARVLAAAQPDLVLACYGMNDGIYQPFDAERFAAFQTGMVRLHDAVTAAGAKLILITSPAYDDQRGKAKGYADVLARQAGWLLEQRAARGWTVLDVHGPMATELARRRAADPAWYFSKDAIHPGAEGHAFIARTVLAALGAPPATLAAPDAAEPGKTDPLPALVFERMVLRRDAWLTSTGHKRPGLPAGLPLPEAEKQALALSEKIQAAPRMPQSAL